jgi:hypothetical protein
MMGKKSDREGSLLCIIRLRKKGTESGGNAEGDVIIDRIYRMGQDGQDWTGFTEWDRMDRMAWGLSCSS